MADIQSSIFIKKPICEVFQYVSSMENMPEMMPNIVQIDKPAPGPLKVGDTVKETRMIRGRTMINNLIITRVEENKAFAYRSEINGLQSDYRYTFEDSEEGTWVNFEADLKTSGFKMRLIKRFLVDMIRREDGNQLQYLKDSLEQTETKQI